MKNLRPILIGILALVAISAIGYLTYPTWGSYIPSANPPTQVPANVEPVPAPQAPVSTDAPAEAPTEPAIGAFVPKAWFEFHGLTFESGRTFVYGAEVGARAWQGPVTFKDNKVPLSGGIELVEVDTVRYKPGEEISSDGLAKQGGRGTIWFVVPIEGTEASTSALNPTEAPQAPSVVPQSWFADHGLVYESGKVSVYATETGARAWQGNVSFDTVPNELVELIEYDGTRYYPGDALPAEAKGAQATVWFLIPIEGTEAMKNP